MSVRLRVNPIACDGHGLCAELFPERVTLDDWGYPIVGSAPIPRPLEQHARRAIDACPVLALRLERLRPERGAKGSVARDAVR
jgi:ferredoxin